MPEAGMIFIENGMNTLNNLLWGWPMIGLLLGTHLFLTVRTKGIQAFCFSGNPTVSGKGNRRRR